MPQPLKSRISRAGISAVAPQYCFVNKDSHNTLRQQFPINTFLEFKPIQGLHKLCFLNRGHSIDSLDWREDLFRMIPPKVC